MNIKKIEEQLGQAKELFNQYKDVKKVSIFGSARTSDSDPEYILAKETGKLLAEKGYYVITGAGPGIMKAGHEGAGVEKSFGLNVELPFETGSNHIIEGDDKNIMFDHFFTRKVTFVRESDAFIACPGGFGTLDELFEVLTLMQTGITPKVPVVLLLTTDIPS